MSEPTRMEPVEQAYRILPKLGWLDRARIRLGVRLMGTDYLMAVGALWLIRDRALDCITPDGHVILAKCKPLADTLYTQLPETWRFTMECVSGPVPDRPPAETT